MRMRFLQNMDRQKVTWLVLLLAVLIPTFFIHSEKYPDWGDDFAQYIYQAQQIHSPSEKYKQVLNVEEYSSPKRSVAFSLILSIIQPTNFIQNYVDLISICYILAGLCFFLFLTKHFSNAVSMLGTLCVFYNFLLLRLKSEVVPEFLFIALFYGILHLTSSSYKRIKYLIPLLLGLLVSVRFVGLSLVICYVVFLFRKKDQTLKQGLKEVGFCILLFLLIVMGVNFLLLNPIHNQEVKLYGNLVFKNYGFKTVSDNVSLYSRYLFLFFEQEVPYWANFIFKSSAIVLFLIGFIGTLKNKITILHAALLVYFFFLFIYPYNGDTIKYLIPIFPLVMFFIIKGVYNVLTYMRFISKEFFVPAFLFVLLLSNSKTIWLAMQSKSPDINPYDLPVLEDFEKVKSIVGNDQSIAFGKPFIINLLADRNSYFLSGGNQRTVLSKADYFLSPKEKVSELHPKALGIKVSIGDTIELSNFYLIRLKKL